MAITEACSVRSNIKNTGKECDTAMVATSMLIAIKRSFTWTKADMAQPVPWLTGLIQQRIAFPLFGQQAPIREITNNKQADVKVTLDDGLEVFLRYGLYNRQFGTTGGGLCYAQALQSFLNSGYSIIEIDQTGQMLIRKNIKVNPTDVQTYSGLICDNMNPVSPDLADFKNTPYKNFFAYSFSPVEMVQNGVIMDGAFSLLSLMGLIDTVLINSATTQTTTNIFFGVQTECAKANLVTQFPTALPTVSNFIVTNSVTGVVVTPSAAAIVSGEVRLTGTYVSGQTYKVIGSAPTVWATNLIVGYDASIDDAAIYIVIP